MRCLDNNCSFARDDQCEGDNCGVMEYRCARSRIGGLSEAVAWKYYIFHPIQFFMDYNNLFKKSWDENQGFVSSSILRMNKGTPHCLDGKFVGPEIQEMLEEIEMVQSRNN